MCKEHAQHLIAILEEQYMISHDWKVKQCLGVDLDWDYARRKLHLSMLLYVKESLIKFNHAMTWHNFISGDMNAAGRPAHAHYSLNACSESFASRSQLKNALKTNFLNISYCRRTYFVRASIA